METNGIEEIKEIDTPEEKEEGEDEDAVGLDESNE